MSKNKDGEGNEIVSFESLELEEGEETPPSKLNEMLDYLKEKLEPADYADLMTKLGIEQDLSNKDLLAALEKMLKGEKEEEEEEEEGEEKKAMDYKEFIKKCMGEGKTLKECAAAFKEKYPEPSKEEVAEVEELAKEFGKKKEEEEEEEEDELTALKARVLALEKEKELAGITSKVEDLVKDRHLAPIQREGALKLAARLDPEGQEELLEFFRTTQKLTVHTDVGRLESPKPGEEGSEITAERRNALIKAHGLDGLIEDKADKTKLPWRNN